LNGILLGRLVAFGLLAIGAGATLAPAASARGYGIPSEDPATLAYVRGLGVRDVALGLILGALAFPESRPALATAVGASALVAAADFSLVSRFGDGTLRLPRLVHGAGTLGLIGLWIALRAGK
jgi:hypothetical protein